MTAAGAGFGWAAGSEALGRVGEGAVGVSGAISGGSPAGAHANASRPAA